MSKFLVRFAVHFYNFYSVLNLKFREGKVEVSNWIVLTNVAKILAISFLSPTIKKFTESHIVGGTFNSVFSRVSYVTSGVLQYSSLFIFCLLHIKNRHKTMRLVKKMLSTSMSPEVSSQLQRTCVRQTVLQYFIFSSLFVVQYFTYLKISLFSLLMWLLICHQTYSIFVFVSFLKNIEQFICAIMEDFRRDLVKYNFRHHERYFRRFQEIHDFVEDFQSSFGLQLTIFVIIFFFHCIFSVSDLILLMYDISNNVFL